MRPRHPFAVAVLATALSLAVPSLFAKSPEALAAKPAAEAAASPVPLLWQVTDDDNTVYLLGSFHMLKASDYPLSDDVQAAFDDAERVVFEVAPEQVNDPANATKFLQAAGFADGRKLSEVLAPDTYEKLSAMMTASGQPVAAVERFEPWFVNLSLVIGMAQPLGFSGAHGLDNHLMQKAREAGKPAAGLESLDHQLAVLDGSPMDEQVLGLAELVEDPAKMARELDKLHQFWRQGDLDALGRYAIDEMKEKTPETYRMVNVERNQAWLPQLREVLDASGEDDVLVVVGAMHLAGDDGLIEGLREAGYRVERVCSACSAD